MKTDAAALEQSSLHFYRKDGPDLLAKCRAFHAFLGDLEEEGAFQTLYRVTVTSGLDHRITAVDPFRGEEVELICFDSNSYLGLHLHPRVTGVVKRAIDRVGFGTPSAQFLCGTNRYLNELEEVVADFHGREATMVFPSGYAANVGVLAGLLRKPDRVAVDRFSHASIHDGAKASPARKRSVFPHRDPAALDRIWGDDDDGGPEGGRLIATDGVFSMHGTLAPLARLREAADRHGALLLIDEAHSTGVLGSTGRGLEEHFGMRGAADILVGTFSKAPGAQGGYVCGSRELVAYLRAFANPGLFTAAVPAATCAGLAEAFRVMQDEPRLRERLWENTERLASSLQAVGLPLRTPVESPIVTVFLGESRLLRTFSRDLFSAGLKCGATDYPAVPRGEAALRLAVNARHTPEDLDRTVQILEALGRRFGILHREQEEIREIGRRIA